MQIPSFDWCAIDPLTVGVPHPGEQPRIPDLLVETEDHPFPPCLEPINTGQRMVPVEGVRTRVMSAYWHTNWPAALPATLLREGASHRLTHAVALLPKGFGVAVWDAWRDSRLQQRLYDTAYSDPHLAPGFVNPPSQDPRLPSPHSTGGTVDLTLTWNNHPLALGTGFDEFVPAANARSLEDVAEGGPEVLARDLRRLLRSVMVEAGFVQLSYEWWHFEYGTRLWAAVNGVKPIYGEIAF